MKNNVSPSVLNWIYSYKIIYKTIIYVPNLMIINKTYIEGIRWIIWNSWNKNHTCLRFIIVPIPNLIYYNIYHKLYSNQVGYFIYFYIIEKKKYMFTIFYRNYFQIFIEPLRVIIFCLGIINLKCILYSFKNEKTLKDKNCKNIM